ncbi:protein jim lovell isoform X1 [Bombyx mandarina]|uniref:Protein jim lovell n=2 Tax=Bombyx TaxID=7090 RepID=A0A8R2DNV4_BOMMO|nr:protein jim lovell isoform X1 [Bombyx mori]XP_028029288.1 protein jim lovell isoform X1 [Bombyx mandarina]
MDDKPTPVVGEEHYSLRWNNHQAHLLRSFEALLHAETLVDVTLVCAERRVRAHKVLLGACSPLFRRIFSENPCKHPVIVLKDFQGWEVQAVVDFMYRGEVSVAQEQLGTVIRAGESLQVRGLADQDREEQARSPPATPLARSPVRATPPAPSPPVSPTSPQPRRKQARPRRRSGESDTPENLSMRRSPSGGLKAVRLSRPRSPPKQEQVEEQETEAPPPPRMFPTHQDMFPPVPPAVSALSLTPPHNVFCPLVFGIDSPLGLFPPGMEHKMYPLMDVEHRAPPLDSQLFTNVKKKWRPKGQHSAPRGGPPRSWTNAELTEALQHVWNKKMTTSQASRIFGIPYNSLLMYVRGKYGKSLKLEQLRKDCIGAPLDVLNLNSGNNNNNHPSSKHHDKDDHQNVGQRPSSSEPDISSNPMFNPFSQGFYPEFPPGFPMPLNMLHLLPPNEKARELYQSMPMALDSLSGTKEEDCKSDRSKENSADEEGDTYRAPHPPHPPPDTRTLLHHNGQD